MDSKGSDRIDNTHKTNSEASKMLIAIIGWVVTLVAAFIGGRVTNANQTQTVSVNVGGQEVIIESPNDFERVYNDLKEQNNNLVIENDRLKDEVKAQTMVTSGSKPDIQKDNDDTNIESEGKRLAHLNVKSRSSADMWHKPIDNYGNQYTDGAYFNIGKTKSNVYIVFDLERKYSTFEGAFILSAETPDSNLETFFMLYDGDEMFYMSDVAITKGSEPFKFSIDVTGVGQLKIRLYHNGDSQKSDDKLGIVDAILY